MDKKFYIAIALRFLRVFVSAGIAQILAMLAITPLTSFEPEVLKKWAIGLIIAFLSGGFAALDKAIRYKE